MHSETLGSLAIGMLAPPPPSSRKENLDNLWEGMLQNQMWTPAIFLKLEVGRSTYMSQELYHPSIQCIRWCECKVHIHQHRRSE